MTLALVILCVLVVALIAIEAYHKIVEREEDDFVHVSDTTGAVIAHQQSVDRTLSSVDRWRMVLLIVTIAYAVVFGVWYTYQSFMAHSRHL
jgi:hypothetical protein